MRVSFRGLYLQYTFFSGRDVGVRQAMTVAAEPRIAYHARRPHEICGFEILLTVRGSEFLALHGGIRRIAAGRPRMLRRSKSVEGSAITTL
jgi:hypothetical protein